MNKQLLRVAKYLSNQGLQEEAAQIKKIAAAAEVGISVSNGNLVSAGREASLSVKKGFWIPVEIKSIEAATIPKQEASGFKIVGSGMGMELTMFVTKEMLRSISGATASGQEQYMTLNYFGPLGNPGDPKQIAITPV